MVVVAHNPRLTRTKSIIEDLSSVRKTLGSLETRRSSVNGRFFFLAKDRSYYPTRRRPQTRLLDRPQVLLEAPRRRPVDVVAIHPTVAVIELSLRDAQAALGARETQDAYRTARVRLAQERSELARTLADASARPLRDA